MLPQPIPRPVGGYQAPPPPPGALGQPFITNPIRGRGGLPCRGRGALRTNPPTTNPVPVVKVKTVEKPLAEAFAIADLPEDESRLEAVHSAGLHTATFCWTYVAPKGTTESPIEECKQSRSEVEMAVGLCKHLTTNGVPAGEIVIVSPFTQQQEAMSAEFMDSNVNRVALNLSGDMNLPESFKWIIFSTVGPATLTQHNLEGSASDIFLKAAKNKAGIIFLASTIFLRTAYPDPVPSTETLWRKGWRLTIDHLRKASFTVAGTTEVVTDKISAYLPLCCPRHPTVCEEAECGEGFPHNFCPYVCLKPFDGCTASNHLCTKPCHRGDHAKCPYPSIKRLSCGHPNRTLCSDPPSCGNSTVERAPCSHEEVVGWDEGTFQIIREVIPHYVTVPCGAKLEDIKCEATVPLTCGVCLGKVPVKCCERLADNPTALPTDCPHCVRLKSTILSEVRTRVLKERDARRLAKERQSMALRMQQVEAAQKGIFVEGQKVQVTDPAKCFRPEEVQMVFGDRNWIPTLIPKKGTSATIRERGSHPNDLTVLLYLCEGQGQEYFIASAEALNLSHTVAELSHQHGNVLMITAGGIPDLTEGEVVAYQDKEVQDIFNGSEFESVAKVQEIGVSKFYSKDSPPPHFRLFKSLAKIRHPDGSNVYAFLCQDVARGNLQRYLLAKQTVFRRPLQKGQKVLIADPTQLAPSRQFHDMYPSVCGWYDGPVSANDSGTILGLANDVASARTYYYIIMLDVRHKACAVQYKGVELDEDAEKLRKEDEKLLAQVDMEVASRMDYEIEKMQLTHVQEEEATARHKEGSRSTLAAMEASRRKMQESAGPKLLSAADRTKKEAELTRLRDDGSRKKKRLDREEEERSAGFLEKMRKHRSTKVKEVPEWMAPSNQPEVEDDNTMAEGPQAAVEQVYPHHAAPHGMAYPPTPPPMQSFVPIHSFPQPGFPPQMVPSPPQNMMPFQPLYPPMQQFPSPPPPMSMAHFNPSPPPHPHMMMPPQHHMHHQQYF